MAHFNKTNKTMRTPHPFVRYAGLRACCVNILFIRDSPPNQIHSRLFACVRG